MSWVSTTRLQYFYNKLFSEKINPIQSDVTKLKTIKTITLGTSWTQDNTNGYYTQSVTVNGITSSDYPIVDVSLTGTLSNMQKQQEEWGKIIIVETSSNILKFYASEPTTVSLYVKVKGI